MKRLANALGALLALQVHSAGAEDAVMPVGQDVSEVRSATAGATASPTKITGERAWDEHEVRLRRGWVAVEQELDLRAVDLQALQARDQAESAPEAEGPSLADDGSIQFIYGEAVPAILCRPLTVCDIALQEGERIVNFVTGTGKGGAWHVGIAVNPYDSDVRTPEPHIIVRPKRHTAEKTTLTIWTDRRSYHLDLIPSEQPMRFVSFRYPDDEKRDLLRAANGPSAEGSAPAESQGPFSPRPWEWHRDYEFDCGSRFWVCWRLDWMKPESVVDDGNVTQITLPRDVLSRERPVFHVISSTGERVQVNYSVHGRTYLIPQVFDEGSLILAHGKRRRHVLEYRIRRVKGD